MARQAMGKGKMGKVQVADLKVSAGSVIVNQLTGEQTELLADILTVYVQVVGNNAIFNFGGIVYVTSKTNVEII